MAGPPQFFLIHRFVSGVYPNQMMGLLPAAFAIPGLLSLVVVLKKVPAENKSRMAQLAWFGGVALFFITLIFPIQFDRQWITIGWALEGAAFLAVPSGAASGTAAHRHRAAHRRIRPARVQSRRARIPSACRHADLQLVSLRLWHCHRLPFRRNKACCPATQHRFEIKCAAVLAGLA